MACGESGRIRSKAKKIPTRRGELFATELDADAALEKWIGVRRSRLETIAERGTYLDRADVAPFLDLSFPGVDELVALIELERMADAGKYDEIYVDTAPTGHTLRMLEMPETLRQIAQVLSDMQAKHRVMAESLARRYSADACDALIDEIEEQGLALQSMLRDPERSSVTWVMLPERLSLEESRDGVAALEAAGIRVERIVANRVAAGGKVACAFCDARRDAEKTVLRETAAWADARKAVALGDLGAEPQGMVALRRLSAALSKAGPLANHGARRPPARKAAKPPRARLLALPLDLPPTLRLLLFGGKGGVGKTTSAAAAALALAHADPSRRVLLLSIDPAHSLGDALLVPLDDLARAVPGAPANLRAQELDAPAAFRARRESYQEAVDGFFDGLRKGSRFDATLDRAVIRDLIDLAPPGIDELLAVLRVTDALFPPLPAEPTFDLVVVDTAPTGHALRWLEMPRMASDWIRSLLKILLKYRNFMAPGKLAADLVEASRQLKALQRALVDPARTQFIAVTRPEALPREETVRLLARLRALKVPIGGVLVNAVRTPSPACAQCRNALRVEGKELRTLRLALDSRATHPCAILLAPAVAPPPSGVEALSRWPGAWIRT